jgi:hypothetical protein
MTRRLVGRPGAVLTLALVGILSLHALPAAAQNGKPFGDLPEADYPSVCGTTRSDAETVKLVALNALTLAETAEGAAEAALAAVRHAALETIVAAGEGGNTSLVAEPLDIALAAAIIAKLAAKGVLDNLEFKDQCIDSAEIKGSYDRLGVLGDWINELASQQNNEEQNVELIESRQLEEFLSRGVVLTSLFLPQQFGGQLEAVRDLVQQSITNMGQAGFDVTRAQEHFDHGMTRFAAQLYRDAYRSFASAYRTLLR